MAAPKREYTPEQMARLYMQNGRNVSATARQIGYTRQSVRHQLDNAVKLGALDPDDLSAITAGKHVDYQNAKARLVSAYAQKDLYDPEAVHSI